MTMVNEFSRGGRANELLDWRRKTPRILSSEEGNKDVKTAPTTRSNKGTITHARRRLMSLHPRTRIVETRFLKGTSHHGGYSHEAVVYALRDCGIRHIDTAKRYGCEEALAKAVAESRVPRDDLWITTKLWPYDYGYHSAKQACLASSARLGVDYLDLYLMHWPDCMVPGRSNRDVRAETWRALEDMYDEGLCHAIGVSNFLISHLEELKDDCGIVPHVNQVEFHPFQQPWDLVRYCQKEGIAFQGFCPLAKGQALSHPLILGLAEKYGRSASQICIGWSIQNGVITIPKSTNPQRIFENCQVFGFQLEEKDMALIGTLHDERHVSWDPTLVK